MLERPLSALKWVEQGEQVPCGEQVGGLSVGVD